MPFPIDPRASEVAAALARLQADPNLSAEKSVSVLRWAQQDQRPDQPWHWYDWLYDLGRWIGELFSWLAQSGRVLMWVGAALLAALLVVYVYRLLRRYDSGDRGGGFVSPSHVRDLDIRPESLPADVAAAALALWDRGDGRAALALLYRGLLSRLVHTHQVPIRDSSTEGDCLALATLHASRAASEYATRLIPVWQRAVYGAQSPQTALVRRLCEEFSAALDSTPAFDPAVQPV